MVTDTSLAAYLELKPSGIISTQKKAVLDYLICHPQCTDLELKTYLNMNINVITARRNELMKEGIIFSPGKRHCSISGKKAHTWQVV